MAFWGRNRWLQQGKMGYGKCPVLPWDEGHVEAAGYRLSVGSEVYINGDSSKSVQKLSSAEAFVIMPGQFAFILTDQKVYIPNSAIGFISIRATIKFKGLVNVSGFQVNPGFRGNLVFAVFNAGPQHVHLRQGDDAFSLWIADLDGAVEGNFESNGKVPNNMDKIPTDVINGIAENSLTAYQLSKKIDGLSDELRTIKELATKIVAGAAVVAVFVIGVFQADIRNMIGASQKSEAVDAARGPEEKN